MKRSIALILLSLVACGPAQPATTKIATNTEDAPKSAPAMLAPNFVDNPDAPFRYRLPLAPEPSHMRPLGVREILLHNGIRAILLSRNEAPVVSVNVVVRWNKPMPIHRTGMALILLDGKSKQPRSLKAGLLENGASNTGVVSFSTANTIEYAAPSSRLEATLTAVFDSFASPVSALTNVDALRNILPKSERSILEQLGDDIEATYFPAAHPYHVHTGPLDSSSVKWDDGVRFRDAELSSASITICIAGDVDPSALESILNRATAGFKPKPPVAIRKAPDKVAPVGMWLSEAPAERAASAVVFPMPRLDDPEFPKSSVMIRVLWKLLLEDKFINGLSCEYEYRVFPGEAYVHFAAEGDAQVGSRFIAAVFDGMRRVAAGEFTNEQLNLVRYELADAAASKTETYRSLTYSLQESAVYGSSPGRIVSHHNDTLDTTRENVIANAQKWLRKNEARIIASGNTTALKDAFSSFEIRPVTVISPKSASGKGKTP